MPRRLKPSTPMEEKKLRTIPPVRVPEVLEVALLRLAAKSPWGWTEYLRNVFIEHVRVETGDATFGEDSAFAKLNAASQCDTRRDTRS